MNWLEKLHLRLPRGAPGGHGGEFTSTAATGSRMRMNAGQLEPGDIYLDPRSGARITIDRVNRTPTGVSGPRGPQYQIEFHGKDEAGVEQVRLMPVGHDVEIHDAREPQPKHTGKQAEDGMVDIPMDDGGLLAGVRGVRPSIAGAVDRFALEAEVQRLMREYSGWTTHVDLGGLDLRMAKLHMEGMLRTAEMFPGIAPKRIQTHKASSGGEGGWSVAWTRWERNKRGGRGTVSFATNVVTTGQRDYTYEDFRQFTQITADRQDWSGDPADMTHTGSHEMAHVVHAGMAYRDVQNLVKSVGTDGLGNYAQTEWLEAWAEMVADVSSRGSQAHPRSRTAVDHVRIQWKDARL